MQAKRDTWIDCLKGVAILLVIWGHTQKGSPVNTWVQTFHVPIFLVITGYLFCKKDKVISSFPSILKKVGWPYIWFSLFAIIVDAVCALIFKGSVTESVIIDIYKTVTLYGIAAIWYLPSYAIATYTVLKEQSKKTRRMASAIFILIAIVMDYFFRLLNRVWDSNLYFCIYYPVSAIVRGLLCSAYIAVGYDLHIFLNTQSKRTSVFLCVIAFILSIGLSPFCADTNLSVLSFGSVPYVFFICSFAGSIAFTTLFFVIGNAMLCKNRFLEYCGKNSLLLLITHMTFKLPEFAWKVEEVIFGSRGYGIIQNLQGIFCLIVVLVFEIPILFLLKKTWLKALIVKK